MNKSLIVFVAFVAFALAGCEAQSEVAKNTAEEYKPTATPPRVLQTPEAIDPGEFLSADTTKQGPTLFADDDDGKKSLSCKEYNRVMVNGDRNEIVITGVCSQIMVNGVGNKITAEAAAEIVSYGSENNISYSKFANGKKPNITDSSGSSTIAKVAAASPAKKK